MGGKPAVNQLGQFAGQERGDLRVFVAQIDIAIAGADDPGADQHALQHAMRRLTEKIAILEGPGLTLVGVDGEHLFPRLAAHQRPFAMGRKAGAAKPA